MTDRHIRRLTAAFSLIGPGIFAIGYTIGTASVTSMAKAGADYGLGLLWVLALSCLFSGVLMSAYGCFAAVTGETTLHGIIRYLPGGKWIAVFVFLGVVMGQYTCLGGIMILTAGAIREAFSQKAYPRKQLLGFLLCSWARPVPYHRMKGLKSIAYFGEMKRRFEAMRSSIQD